MAPVHLDYLSYSYSKMKCTIIYLTLNFMTFLIRLFWSKETAPKIIPVNQKKVENDSRFVDSSYRFGRSSNYRLHIFARRSVFHYFHLGAQVGNCS